jgi:murein DD-endopeptidase MepM/ murein hydrolase activator NlpD
MSIFTIEMSSPFPPGSFTRDFGGPNSGGHRPPEWFIQFGMDLGANPGTEVHAVFDGHVTVFHPHTPSGDSSSVFGAQIFIRSQASPTAPSFSDDKVGAFYTHITDVPASIRAGSSVKRGDLLGKLFRPGATHLHLALVEIIGGAPGGRYTGVNIFGEIMGIANTSKVLSVTFQQNGSPPTVVPV